KLPLNGDLIRLEVDVPPGERERLSHTQTALSEEREEDAPAGRHCGEQRLDFGLHEYTLRLLNAHGRALLLRERTCDVPCEKLVIHRVLQDGRADVEHLLLHAG